MVEYSDNRLQLLCNTGVALSLLAMLGFTGTYEKWTFQTIQSQMILRMIVSQPESNNNYFNKFLVTPVYVLLWILYMSLKNVGQIFYGKLWVLVKQKPNPEFENFFQQSLTVEICSSQFVWQNRDPINVIVSILTFPEGYGWEMQLQETGFLAIFFARFDSTDVFDASSPPSELLLWLLRWLNFRIMMGAVNEFWIFL